MSAVNRPLPDENHRHALLLAIVLDTHHLPGFLRGITEDDGAWSHWVAAGKSGRMDIVRKLLTMIVAAEEDDSGDNVTARLRANIGEQRELYETLLTAAAATGSRTAAQILFRLRTARLGITTERCIEERCNPERPTPPRR